jgi:hypothetical protein
MSHRALAGIVAALLLPAAAQAADPGRWKLAGLDAVPTEYFQGLTHGPGGVFWIGLFDGAYRTDTKLKETARITVIYPEDVQAIGFNHAGDPTFDAGEGGRLLAPMECYHPDQPQANTCGIGGFGVVDPQTLAWRYWVRLDQADILKAMWAEVAPDGPLIWTSSGTDLLAYRTTDIAPANAATGADSPPIHPVQRLMGVVPPSGITGAVFVGGRLFLAGDLDGQLQVRSVDLTGATPPRTEIEMPKGFHGESEGLDLLDMRGGTLHWLWSPLVADPTYGSGHSELLTFVPAAQGKLRVTAKRAGRGATLNVRHRFAGKDHPVAGAQVIAGSRRATTNAAGRATFTRVPARRLKVKASKLDLVAATATLPAK